MRSGSAPLLWLAGLALAAGAWARAGEPPRGALTADERQRISGMIDRCADVEPDRALVRKSVAELVREVSGRDDAVRHLIEYGLGHRLPLSRMAAIEAVGAMGREMSAALRKRALAGLDELAEFDLSYSVRCHAARTIAGFGNADVLARLYAQLPDFDGSLSRDILANDQGQLQELGRLISRSLRRFDTLIDRIESGDQEVRDRAREELQRLTDEKGRRSAEDWRKWQEQNRDKLKGKPDSALFGWDVNVTADRAWLMALIELAGLARTHNAVDGLCFILDHGNLSERMSAASALGQLGGAAAVARLRQELSGQDGWMRATAAEALAAVDPVAVAADLFGLLDDWAPRDSSPEHRAALLRVRRAAVAGLAAAGERAAAGRIAKLLADRAVGRALGWDLVDALRRIGGVAELPALARHAALCRERERRAALDAVAEICRREAPPAALGGRRLAAAGAAELLELAAGRDEAAGVAAVWELDRRWTPADGDESLVRLMTASGTGPARMMAVAAIAARGWAPAVAAAGRASLSFREDQELSRAACLLTAELGSPAGVAAWLERNPARTGPGTRAELEGLRRKAAAGVAEAAMAPGLAPDTAIACAEALKALAFGGSSAEEARPELSFGGDVALQRRVQASMVAVLANAGLREAVPAACAALRLFTIEEFPDEPRYWLQWWQKLPSKPADGSSRK
ncbi:MAG TPA: hypothetical protein PK280_02655 [Planctomycetota bacterium]|nr:hypothetical protein [Planctomycetota bacterium]